jgi:TetR/AcrR family transcriptional repressor of nem operon
MSSDTRSNLITQAEYLVRRRGYAGFSYADLATAVGIRKPKEDLGVALVDAYGERYDHAMDAIRRSTGDGLKRVEAYADLYLHGLQEEQGCLCAAMAIELDILPGRIRAGVTAFFRRHIEWLEGVLREGCGNGTIRKDVNPVHHARMIVATLEGALLMERMLGGPAGFKDTLSALRQSLS